MKKFLLLSLLSCCFLNSFSAIAMDESDETMDIRAITPIKSGMNSEQRRGAIQSFLRESLTNKGMELKTADISSEQKRQCGGVGRLFDTYTFKDGSEWVMGAGGLNRFLGYLYLQKAIEHYGLKNVCVAETRFAYKKPSGAISISVKPIGDKPLENIPTIDSQDFFSLSRYVGDDRPALGEVNEELDILHTKIGFTDFLLNSNLRKKDGKIYVIDTEYGSFSSTNISPYMDEDGELKFTFSRDSLV